MDHNGGNKISVGFFIKLGVRTNHYFVAALRISLHEIDDLLHHSVNRKFNALETIEFDISHKANIKITPQILEIMGFIILFLPPI